MKEKRASVVAEMKRLQADTEVITKIFEDEDISKSIQSTRLFACNVFVSHKNLCVFIWSRAVLCLSVWCLTGTVT